MNERYEVRLRKAVHVFSAGHFITLTDDVCEAVHGHNWTVGVDVAGEPDAHGMVVDFIALRDAVTAVVSRLDHRMLLPTENRWLSVATASGPTGLPETTVRFRDRRWIFPAGGEHVGRVDRAVDRGRGAGGVRRGGSPRAAAHPGVGGRVPRAACRLGSDRRLTGARRDGRALTPDRRGCRIKGHARDEDRIRGGPGGSCRLGKRGQG
jgi:6-pyruvoyl tetrahydropterin synthase/QueD family protein